jgi:hypothetical protein
MKIGFGEADAVIVFGLLKRSIISEGCPLQRNLPLKNGLFETGAAKRGFGKYSFSFQLYLIEVYALKLSTKEVGISSYARSEKDGVSLELCKLQIQLFQEARSSKVGVAAEDGTQEAGIAVKYRALEIDVGRKSCSPEACCFAEDRQLEVGRSCEFGLSEVCIRIEFRFTEVGAWLAEAGGAEAGIALKECVSEVGYS